MQIATKIQIAVKQAILDNYQQDITPDAVVLQETRKEFKGDITLVTFAFTKLSKLSPEETGNVLGQYLQAHVPEITGFNVVKGFLNLEIADTYWLQQLLHLAQPNYGQLPAKNKKVMVEYSSPNTNKPLHLGHVRNNLLGYSVAELLKAAGYEVVKANLVNDRGIHICKSMLAWQRFGNGETPASSGLKGDKLVGKYYVAFDKAYRAEVKELEEKGINKDIAEKEAPLIKAAQAMLLKWEEKDAETIALWTMMNGWVYAGFDVTYKSLGVDFDTYYYESNTYLLGKELVEEGLTKGVFFAKDDGSVWIDLTADGLDQKLLLRSDGTSVYMTQDVGTAQLKYDDFKVEKSIYVVGNEQDYHFKVLFLILEKLGKSWAKGLYHLSYGMVDLPNGKMKSREGTVVDADDLIAEMIATAKENTEALGKTNDFTEEEKTELYRNIGLGALKYHLLKVDPKKRLLFDPAESIDLQGHTGPFIQYSYARIQSVLRKAAYVFNSESFKTVNTLTPIEREIVILYIKFEEVIAHAAAEYSPALMANYLYELAKAYNKFYHDEPILKLDDEQLKQFRLYLSAAVGKVLARGMQLLGIEVPERM